MINLEGESIIYSNFDEVIDYWFDGIITSTLFTRVFCRKNTYHAVWLL